MAAMPVHEYFDRTASEWNIIEFLDECDLEPFQCKLDDYLKSLEMILASEKGKKYDKAKLLLDRYKEVSVKILVWV